MTTIATFTIGRTTGLRARTVRYDGNSLAIDGYVLPASDGANGVLAARQQLRGLLDNLDEEAFPVTCSADSTIDGYYVPTSVAVDDLGPFGASKARFSIRMDRLRPDATGVLLEGSGVVFTRANSHSITGQSGQWSVPTAATMAIPPNQWTKNVAPINRVADSGSLFTAFIGESSATAFGQYVVPVANHYDGSARVERLYGSTYREVVNRQASLTSSNWRLTNGLIRLQASATANRLFDIYSYNGSAWSTSPITINLSGALTGSGGATEATATNPKVEAVNIIRNSPEVCTVRLSCRWTSQSIGGSVGNPLMVAAKLSYSIILVDISLRRGDHMAVVNVLTSPLRYIKMRNDAVPASTTLTGGVRTTANIANGNNDRLVMCTTATLTTNDGNSGIGIDGNSRSGSVRSGFFGVGLEIGGSGATGQNAAQELIYQLLTPFSEQQRVVLR